MERNPAIDQTEQLLNPEEPIDPVSGNEVPLGAEPEEVRDDVNINVSGGEFIFPADVVEFYGIDKLRKMMEKAKEGIAQLHEDGLTGEDTDEDGEGEAFAMGGRVGYANKDGQTNETGVRVFTDRTGFIHVLPVIDGEVMGEIPEGSEEISGSDKAKRVVGSGLKNPPPEPNTEGGKTEFDKPKSMTDITNSYDISELSDQELRDYMGQQKSLIDALGSRSGMLGRAAVGMIPGVGTVAGFASALQKPIYNSMISEAKTRKAKTGTQLFDDMFEMDLPEVDKAAPTEPFEPFSAPKDNWDKYESQMSDLGFGQEKRAEKSDKAWKDFNEKKGFSKKNRSSFGNDDNDYDGGNTRDPSSRGGRGGFGGNDRSTGGSGLW